MLLKMKKEIVSNVTKHSEHKNLISLLINHYELIPSQENIPIKLSFSLPYTSGPILRVYNMRVYPKVSGLAAWS
jgi:hypothetical protein